MLKNVVRIFGGDPNKKAIEANIGVVDQINALEAEFEALGNEDLRAKTDEFRIRLGAGETLEDLLVEAYATVREASKRTLGQRHYDVQIIGAVVLHQGKVAEMRTGEGKTLMATMPIYLNALEGEGTHLVTVNDYLARRDARWMSPIYNLLGLTVGVLQMASRTEGSKKAFMVNLEKESSHEDQHQLDLVDRKIAYQADITYGTNNEFGFDYLRDNMAMRLENRTQRGHHYAIIDEVDNVLIDEARTPLIISGPSHDDTDNFKRMTSVVKRLKTQDYEINERDRNVTLTEIGETSVERILGVPLRDPERPEDITLEQARLLGFLEQALRAQFLFRRNKEYLVQGGKVIIIDEFTGRLMPGRRWSDGLHQAVEAKEGVKIEGENSTYATITIQNYFRMYAKLSGMTGTALTEAEEFNEIYGLDVLPIPPNVDYNADREDGSLASYQDTDEYGYKFTYYAERDDPEKKPIFWRRKDYPDIIYRSVEIKFRAIVREILQYHVIGRPILVGTTSVQSSEQLSGRMRGESVRRLLQTLLLRYVWFEKNDREEDGRLIMELSYLNEKLEQLQISQMRQMARKLEITLNLEDDTNLNYLMDILGLEIGDKDRLVSVIKGGISHQVLNARKHTEESKIIAGAGAFGAVTIATNMAGRGVDIKLGGEIAEEVLSIVNRILKRAGFEEAFEMSLEEQKNALLKLNTEDYGIYEAEIKFFLQSMDDMVKVKELGGLHVIGSERHNARRIDNQLRGRAARQGDLGSSRFYLSMEDELMRLFGGDRMEMFLQRFNFDEAIPIPESSMVNNIIESSQTRVEGANFDTRKHVLEYDDVLNTQRSTIYEQRNTIFLKDDLSEDVSEMLQIEVLSRVPGALEDKEGPWKLLGWLEQIQPTFKRGEILFPSFTIKLLLDYVKENDLKTEDDVLNRMMDVARASLDAQKDHILNSVTTLLDVMQERLDTQLKDSIETMETFFDGLSLADETDTRRPSDLITELSALLRFPLKLSNHEQRLFDDDPDALADQIAEQIEVFNTTQTITRSIGAVERRLEKSLDLNVTELAVLDWDSVTSKIISEVETEYEKRRDQLIGEKQDGHIAKGIQSQLSKSGTNIDDEFLISLLISMPRGERAIFDKKTHKRVIQRTTRLTYVYFAAQLVQGINTDKTTQLVMDHLNAARVATQQAWGIHNWERLATERFKDFDEKIKTVLGRVLAGSEEDYAEKRLEDIVNGKKEQVIDALGRHSLTQIYRELLLRVISELWVDYLTRIEALRISIGLEAYAQRDPLVQYKAKAFELFQNLFSDMRISLVNRMFVFQPRNINTAQAATSSPELPDQALEEEAKPKQKSTKRKRRRRRKKKK